MEPSKFSGALANLNKPQVKEKVQPSIDETAEIIQPTIERGRGRPRAKSSDPEYQSTTVILRKRTKRTANRLLEDQEAGQDLSELIEELLLEWIQKHS